ncbi:hypothetical protein ACOME3_010253 [Neoechinorhynchus agilis]
MGQTAPFEFDPGDQEDGSEVPSERPIRTFVSGSTAHPWQEAKNATERSDRGEETDYLRQIPHKKIEMPQLPKLANLPDCNKRAIRYFNEGEDDGTQKSSKIVHLVPSGSAPIDFHDISAVIMIHYQSRQQSSEVFAKKLLIRDIIGILIVSSFPTTSLYISGSTLTDLATNDSDVDMSALEDSNCTLDRDSVIRALYDIKSILLFLPQISNAFVIRARVPIVRFTWTNQTPVDGVDRLICDLNFGNEACVRNTHLVHAYTVLDWRVAPLIFFIKKWAKHNGINDAPEGTFSSYALCLLTISFLQVKCVPPVLPSLQKILPSIFNATRDLRELDAEHEQMGQILMQEHKWKSKNVQSEGELFLGFIEYYAEFSFNSRIVSVRTGNVHDFDSLDEFVSKQDLFMPVQMNVEEPFEHLNVTKGITQDKYRKIIMTFKSTAHFIRSHRSIEELVGLE